MAFPTTSVNFSTPFLRKVQESGFEGFYQGSQAHFFELLGAAILDHGHDWTFAETQHLSGFLKQNSRVMKQSFSLQVAGGTPAPWEQLRSSVLKTIMSDVGTPHGFQCLSEGSMPNLENAALMELIAKALNVCIVWYEWVDAAICTRFFVRPEDSTWTFFVYMGRENNAVFTFRHPSMTDHSDLLSCVLKDNRNFRPLIIGKELHAEDSNALDFLHTVIDAIATLSPEVLSEEIISTASEYLREWSSVSSLLDQELAPSNVTSEEVKNALGNIVRMRSSYLSALQQHKISLCTKFSMLSTDYVTHLCGNDFHRICLQRFIEEKQMNDAGSLVRCPKCPRFFKEDFIASLFQR